MRKRTPLARAIPGRRLDLDDHRPVLRQQFATKGACHFLGKLKDADTGERQVGNGHRYAS
jgi:hypothetical protein